MAIMKTVRKVTTVVMGMAFLATLVVVSGATRSESQDSFDAAATYKSKCLMCHGPKSEKKFDPAKADADHVQAVLKGKKMEKPPNMPGYEEKGMTEDQAKAMVAYMRSIQ